MVLGNAPRSGTYIPTREGWLYLAAVLDVYSRAIVGWAMSQTLGGQLTTDALAMAISRRGVPELVHSDRGSTYATSLYLDFIRKHGIRQSMSRKGNCWDNAPMESFFHSLKTELVMHCDYKSRDQARQPVRLHGSLLQPPAPPLHHQLRGSASF
jgi:putative transposase